MKSVEQIESFLINIEDKLNKQEIHNSVSEDYLFLDDIFSNEDIEALVVMVRVATKWGLTANANKAPFNDFGQAMLNNIAKPLGTASEITNQEPETMLAFYENSKAYYENHLKFLDSRIAIYKTKVK